MYSARRKELIDLADSQAGDDSLEGDITLELFDLDLLQVFLQEKSVIQFKCRNIFCH